MNWYGRHAESPTEQLPDLVEPDLGEPDLGEPDLGGPDLGGPDLGEPGLGGPDLGGDQVDLDDDPFADDLSEQLAAKAPRRLANRGTVVLAGLVLVIGGFVAGAQVEKHFGTV